MQGDGQHGDGRDAELNIEHPVLGTDGPGQERAQGPADAPEHEVEPDVGGAEFRRVPGDEDDDQGIDHQIRRARQDDGDHQEPMPGQLSQPLSHGRPQRLPPPPHFGPPHPRRRNRHRRDEKKERRDEEGHGVLQAVEEPGQRPSDQGTHLGAALAGGEEPGQPLTADHRNQGRFGERIGDPHRALDEGGDQDHRKGQEVEDQ
nr:hypothetical protein [Herbidospora daliensis]